MPSVSIFILQDTNVTIQQFKSYFCWSISPTANCRTINNNQHTSMMLSRSMPSTPAVTFIFSVTKSTTSKSIQSILQFIWQQSEILAVARHYASSTSSNWSSSTSLTSIAVPVSSQHHHANHAWSTRYWHKQLHMMTKGPQGSQIISYVDKATTCKLGMLTRLTRLKNFSISRIIF